MRLCISRIFIQVVMKWLAGSMPSLAMGVACGAVMGVGAYQTTNDPKNVSLSLGKFFLLL